MITNIIKLFSTIFLISTLGFSFVGQNLIVNAADPVVPPATTSTAAPAPKPTVAKSDGPSIGSLKACVVDKSRKNIDPEEGNKIIRDCIKSVINLVITLAVLISIASLVGYGIQLMNPMMESGKINGQIVERIKSLAIGGLILGSFGTILATINPATLTSNQLLGKPVIDSFREYISLGVKNSPPSKGGTGSTGGAGTTGKPNPIVAKIIKPDGTLDQVAFDIIKKNADQKEYKDLVTLITDNDKCTNIFADKTCDNFAPSDPKIIATLEKAGVTSSFNQVANIKGPISLKYDAKITKNQTSGIYTATFTINGKEQKETFKLLGTAVDPCDEKTLDLGNVTKAGETIILNGCSIVPGIT